MFDVAYYSRHSVISLSLNCNAALVVDENSGSYQLATSTFEALHTQLAVSCQRTTVKVTSLTWRWCSQPASMPLASQCKDRERERNGGHIKVSRSFIEKVQFQLDRTVRFPEMMQTVLDQQEQPQENPHMIDNSDSQSFVTAAKYLEPTTESQCNASTQTGPTNDAATDDARTSA